MNRIFFLFIFIIILFLGCRKDYPAVSSEASVFYFNGTVNNTAVKIEAGVNSYYMYSSFTQDSNNVFNFLGELKPANCISCNNKIKFQINDFAYSAPSGNAQINTSLLPAYYSMQEFDSVGSPTEYPVIFSVSSDSTNIAGFTWDFGDGISETGNLTSTHIYTHPGYYNACLTINDGNGCSSNICSQIKAGVPDASCDVSIIDSLPLGNTILFSASGNGASNTYFWDFGDGSTSILNNVSHTFLNSGIYKVILKQITNSGCISYASKNVSTQGFVGCIANFNFSVQSTNPNPFALSNVIISWTNSAGAVYTSNNFSQSSDSYFQIVSVENYLNNESNEPTKKLHIKFRCGLSDGTNSILINDGDAVIAVSYR